MFATTIRFQMPDDTDWEKVRQQAVHAAFDVFREVRGLRSKAFIFSPERSEFGGNYVWETQDDAEAYLRSERWRAMASRLGEPRIERSEVCAYVECGDLVYPPERDLRPTTSARDALGGSAASP
jgi:hypothetical protein